jgi:hypothetical protein
MQHCSVCPGCGRLITTQYAFMHQSGRSVMVFCLASCFVRWRREQQWRQHHTATSSAGTGQQAAASPRGFDERWPMSVAQTAARQVQVRNSSRATSESWSFDVLS